MTELEELRFLNSILLEELPHCQRDAEGFSPDAASQRRLLRALMNVRPPKKLRTDFITVQDRLLQREVRKKGIVDIATLPTLKESALYTGKHASQLILWQGDITRLNADAIVNAANSALLGCFCPGHRCIDNEIHSAAGLQLRNACAQLMLAQGHDEPTGQARLTPACNLPSRYVLHTVGPIIPPQHSRASAAEAAQLAACYRSCLELAAENDLHSIAFCCISTGEFHFPNEQAAQIAIRTVLEELDRHPALKVVFNVFKDKDAATYQRELQSFRNSPCIHS